MNFHLCSVTCGTNPSVQLPLNLSMGQGIAISPCFNNTQQDEILTDSLGVLVDPGWTENAVSRALLALHGLLLLLLSSSSAPSFSY